MVVGPKVSLQHMPSKGRMSIYKIQNFTVQKRQPVLRLIYGVLFIIISIVIASINPLKIITNFAMDMKEGSRIYNMWEKPTYELFCQVYIFNYTNVREYLDGDSKVLKMEEVGPFIYQEFRTNRNITINKEKGVMTMQPNVELKFRRDLSLADPNDVVIFVPNMALLAISTLASDKLPYIANVGAYYSINALGSKLFVNITAEEYLWGYYDPLVTVASNLLPGWIDFGKIGILDRFYAPKEEEIEIELGEPEKKYSLNSWGRSAGIVEQGFSNLDNSNLCNRIKGSYEGLMLTPNIKKESVLPIYRKQACRVYPFLFEKALNENYGFNYHRYKMDPTALNKTSPYACDCSKTCPPDGFVDISGCYYGFPLTLSKPHFMDTDPVQQSYFEGMVPDREKHTSHIDVEPNLGIPISLNSMIQVNVAVRASSANPLTKPLKDKMVPLAWLSLFCTSPPPDVVTILRVRFVIAPPLMITVEVLLFTLGLFLGIQGTYRIWKPTYKLIEPTRSSPKKRKVSYPVNISDNKAFKDDDDYLAKEAVSLLAVKEDELDDIPDLLIET